MVEKGVILYLNSSPLEREKAKNIQYKRSNEYVMKKNATNFFAFLACANSDNSPILRELLFNTTLP